jgi:hypothetical protein
MTYYIDYVAGSDSNNGTATSTPWKRCPGMVGFTGTYTHATGDHFIFKGGITWPRSVFQFHITNSGASGNPDYYGADVAWYNGGSFAKPVFDFENTVITGGGFDSVGVQIEGSYVTLDQIDLKRYRTPAVGAGDYGSGTINFTGSAANVTVQYCVIRDWDNGGGDDGGSGGGIWAFSDGANIRILHNEFHCANIVNRTGRSVSLNGEIAYNEVHDVSTFLLGGGEVHHNYVHDLQGATDPTAHENAFYIFTTSNVYNNILHDIDVGCSSYYLSPGFLSVGAGTTLCYNNVGWNLGTDAAISIETEGSYPTNKDIKVFNNTVEHGSGWCIRVVARGPQINSLELANNYCITTGTAHNIESGSVTTLTDHGTDLTKTPTQATADGATVGTVYKPSTGTAINGGISMSSYFTTDIGGVSRPQGSAWDVGAYELNETHWYVRTSSAGSANGTNWSNAWSITNLNSNWSSIGPGDTIWFAGGSYTTGIEMGASGTAGNIITFKRATVANHGTDTGWSSGFDSQVVIAPSGGGTPVLWYYGGGDYVTIDGVTTNGIKLQYDNTSVSFLGGVSCGGSINFYVIIILYCDISGPGTGTYGNPVLFLYTADNAPILVKGSGDVYNVTFSYCDVHSGVNIIQAGYIGIAYNWILEHCRFFDNVVDGGFFHANVFYTQGAHDWTIRYCDFSGWHVEGIVIFSTMVPINFYVYGNVFHHQVSGSPSCFWNADIGGGVDGPLYLYNNTFYGVTITNGQSNDRPFASGSLARNNIYWNSTWADAISDSDYNFSDSSGTGKGGARSITTGVNPFINGPAGNFHIVGTVGATYPRDKGVSLGSPYQTDPDGVTRGGDGTWDMGSYEFSGTSVTAYGLLTLKTSKPLAATGSFLGNLATQLSHIGAFFQNVAGNLTFVGSFKKSTRRTLAAALSFVGLLIRGIPQRLTAALSFIGSLAKRDARSVAAALSFAGSLRGRGNKILSGAVSFVGAITRKASHLLQSVLSFVGNFGSLLSHAGANFLSIASNLSFVGSLPRSIKHSLTSVLSFLGLTGRGRFKAMTAAISFAGNTLKRFPRALAASIAFIGNITIIRAITKALAASLAFIGTLGTAQAISRLFTAAVTFTGTIARRIPKSISGFLSFIGDLAGNVPAILQKTFSATLSLTGYFYQRFGKVLRIVVKVVSSVLKININTRK